MERKNKAWEGGKKKKERKEKEKKTNTEGRKKEQVLNLSFICRR